MGKSSAMDWERGKKIGEGCFGTVSIGVNKSDGRVFAVKSVDLATCHPSQLQALEREITILRSLSSSPYIAQYLNDDKSSSFRNLHVAYVPGGKTLADAPARDEETVRSLTWCLVSALKHVHSKGIVHCDVKGRNVLIGPGVDRATLVDFGSAAEVGDSAAAAEIRGSPLWMAPEVVRGESQGTESDVWSLGCTVLEIVTGRPAWEDRGGETLRRIGFSDDLPEIPKEVSESGRDFVEKCLRRDPRRRWSCERLLRHPWLAGAAVPEEEAPAAGISPRCVLDCDFGDDDDVEYDDVDWGAESSARERIGKLAGIGGVNWETEDWTVVREFGGEGVVSGISNLTRVEREILGTLCCRDGQRECDNLLVAWLSSLCNNINIIIVITTVLLFVKKFNELKLITSYIDPLQFANITHVT